MRLAAVLLAGLVVTSAAAQPVWRPDVPGTSVSLDVLKSVGQDGVMFGDESGQPLGEASPNLVQSAQILSARVPVGRVVAVVELPFAVVSYSYPDDLEQAFDVPIRSSDVGVGNPYLGAEYAVSPGVVVEGGVRLPLASRDDGAVAFFTSDGVGYLADVERPEAFLPDVASATVGVTAQRSVAPGVDVRVELAPTLMYDTRGSVDLTSDGVDDPFRPGPALWARYGAQVVLGVGPALLHGGLAGRQGIASDPYYTLSHTASAVLGVVAAGLPVRPGVLVRVPVLGEFRPDPVVGLSLTVPLR